MSSRSGILDASKFNPTPVGCLDATTTKLGCLDATTTKLGCLDVTTTKFSTTPSDSTVLWPRPTNGQVLWTLETRFEQTEATLGLFPIIPVRPTFVNLQLKDSTSEVATRKRQKDVPNPPQLQDGIDPEVLSSTQQVAQEIVIDQSEATTDVQIPIHDGETHQKNTCNEHSHVKRQLEMEPSTVSRQHTCQTCDSFFSGLTDSSCPPEHSCQYTDCTKAFKHLELMIRSMRGDEPQACSLKMLQYNSRRLFEKKLKMEKDRHCTEDENRAVTPIKDQILASTIGLRQLDGEQDPGADDYLLFLNLLQDPKFLDVFHKDPFLPQPFELDYVGIPSVLNVTP